jgi:hypothetical protein
MTREDVIEQAKAFGWVVRVCEDPSYVAIRSYKSDTNEKMRIGSGAEIYVLSEGWMWQVGTFESFEQAIKDKLKEIK